MSIVNVLRQQLKEEQYRYKKLLEEYHTLVRLYQKQIKTKKK